MTLPTLEELFTSDEYFAVSTATPLQRAICRISDGAPIGELRDDSSVRSAMSDWVDGSRSWDGLGPGGRPRELVILAGTRTGKTRLAMSAAVRMALTVDVSRLKPGEVPRVPIVSLTLDLAGAAYGQLRATVIDRPRLASLLVEEPTGGRLLLRHPSGCPVEITVSAGKRAGSSLVARWLAGAIFDEAPRMAGADDGSVVHLDDSLAAIQSRLLPGSQVLAIGSPWAPAGPVYRKVMAHHGRPTTDITVIRARGEWLNPVWWTPERMASMGRSSEAAAQISYRTDCMAEWVDAESGLISSADLDAVTRPVPLVVPPRLGVVYAAAIDPAARLNAWTLVVKMRRRGVDVVVLAKQWLRGPGGGAMDPDSVLGNIASLLRPYGVSALATDKWQIDSLKSLGRRHGLVLVEYDYAGQELSELYLDMQARIANRAVELPPDGYMRADLLGMRRSVTSTGMSIQLTSTGDGRHGDYAPSLARVLRMHVPDSEPEPIMPVDVEDRLLAAAKQRWMPQSRGKPWWQER